MIYINLDLHEKEKANIIMPGDLNIADESPTIWKRRIERFLSPEAYSPSPHSRLSDPGGPSTTWRMTQESLLEESEDEPQKFLLNEGTRIKSESSGTRTKTSRIHHLPDFHVMHASGNGIKARSSDSSKPKSRRSSETSKPTTGHLGTKPIYERRYSEAPRSRSSYAFDMKEQKSSLASNASISTPSSTNRSLSNPSGYHRDRLASLYPRMYSTDLYTTKRWEENRRPSIMSLIYSKLYGGLKSNEKVERPFKCKYQLEPTDFFPSSRVKKIIIEVLEHQLYDEEYSPKLAGRKTVQISNELKERMKMLHLDRYKFICLVNLMSKDASGVCVASRGLLDSDTDSYAEGVYQTDSIYAVSIVYGVYTI